MRWVSGSISAGRVENSRNLFIYSLFRTKCSQDRIKTVYKTQKIDTQKYIDLQIYHTFMSALNKLHLF